MNTILDPLKKVEDEQAFVVFLAGPITDAPAWQKDVLPLCDELGIDGVTFLSPRKITRGFPSGGMQQMNWETRGLRRCDVALFWIPNPIRENASRVYAQTTRMELAENLALGKKIILGVDTDISGRDYICYKAGQYGITCIHTSLADCLKELKTYLNR